MPDSGPEPRIWLVGAGPGDPDLLTVKAHRLIAAADIILHDALVTPEILALANPAAELIPVGKRAGAHAMPQAAINALLVAAGRRGTMVVRLKGGDPTIFGRLTEEMQALRRANLTFEIVPGITAACAAAAAAQISLSQRGRAQAVTFVTGHAQADAPLDLDWPALAAANTTLAIYMGKSAAAGVSAQLRAHGMPGDTPVLITENAARSDQRALATDLAHLADAAIGTGPAVILIGAAVAIDALNRTTSATADPTTAPAPARQPPSRHGLHPAAWPYPAQQTSSLPLEAQSGPVQQ
nr:uroporphyrinogen-III C-methyltransferase [Polymorphobacter sp.]